MKKQQKAIKNLDYILDPETSRATFKKNNKAAIIHGGYSQQLEPELLDAILDNDLGYETGVLKHQMTNIHIIGSELIQKLLVQGDEATALSVALSCADRSSKLAPQIQKLLEKQNAQLPPHSEKVQTARKKWLKKLQNGTCLPSEVAYQFETLQLGELPVYVNKMIDIEIRNTNAEIEDEQFSRTDLQQQIEQYREEIKHENQNKQLRQEAVHSIKQRINQKLFNTSEDSDHA